MPDTSTVQIQPQEACATIDRAVYSGPTVQHELDHVRPETDLPCVTDLDHELWEISVDALPESSKFPTARYPRSFGRNRLLNSAQGGG